MPREPIVPGGVEERRACSAVQGDIAFDLPEGRRTPAMGLRPIRPFSTAHAHADLSTPTASCRDRGDRPWRPVLVFSVRSCSAKVTTCCGVSAATFTPPSLGTIHASMTFLYWLSVADRSSRLRSRAASDRGAAARRSAAFPVSRCHPRPWRGWS